MTTVKFNVNVHGIPDGEVIRLGDLITDAIVANYPEATVFIGSNTSEEELMRLRQCSRLLNP